jgi:branched-chain amino acid transport system permease protein
MHSGNYKETYGQLVAAVQRPAQPIWLSILALCLVALPLAASPYVMTLAIKILIWVTGIVGLNLLIGGTGLISLGYSGFLAIGAYANTIIVARYGLSPVFGILFGGAIAALVSLLVSIPSLRLRDLYLAITTLAFSLIVTHLILASDGLTGGSQGLTVPPALVLGWEVDGDIPLYFFCLFWCVLALLAVVNLGRSKVGRAFSAIRDQDIAASMMGISVTRFKVLAFMISSFFTGISGALMGYQFGYINVDNFNVLLSIEAVSMVILGGMGSIPGAILGVVFMTLLPEIIRVICELAGGSAGALFSTRALEVRGLIYGITVVLFLRFQPEGLVGWWHDVKKYWTNWPFTH